MVGMASKSEFVAPSNVHAQRRRDEAIRLLRLHDQCDEAS